MKRDFFIILLTIAVLSVGVEVGKVSYKDTINEEEYLNRLNMKAEIQNLKSLIRAYEETFHCLETGKLLGVIKVRPAYCEICSTKGGFNAKKD